jgi:hypothetical protein
MRVEEDDHSMYSRKSSSGASKSGAIRRMLSLALPAIHGHDVRWTYRTWAKGCSFSVIVISSPG